MSQVETMSLAFCLFGWFGLIFTQMTTIKVRFRCHGGWFWGRWSRKTLLNCSMQGPWRSQGRNRWYMIDVCMYIYVFMHVCMCVTVVWMSKVTHRLMCLNTGSTDWGVLGDVGLLKEVCDWEQVLRNYNPTLLPVCSLWFMLEIKDVSSHLPSCLLKGFSRPKHSKHVADRLCLLPLLPLSSTLLNH